MTDEAHHTESECHRRFAKELFNFVWTLLEKSDRTPEENDTMVHAAHASRHHWGQVGTAVNLARGEWQVSRVYAVLQRAEPSRFHAQRCLDICRTNGIGDFDLAFAYEALARASAVAGHHVDRHQYLELASKAGERIAGEEDRRSFFEDLKTIPM